MENAGAVTFTEVYVFRAKVTEAIVERRALTILHELAHMWFGNLVTMRWWDDLWLNESFAEWASTTVPGRGHPSGPTPGRRSAPRRRPGPTARTSSPRRTRSSPTSATCDDVEVNFDGITYAKGASVLKQLVAYVGPRAVHRRAARLLPPSTPGATPRCRTCSPSWSRPPGATCRPGPSCGWRPPGSTRCGPRSRSTTQGVITAASITQTAAEGFPTLRPHRLAVGLYAVQRRPAGAHGPARARRRRRAHRGARARRPSAARPAAGQRRRPRLRQDPPRRALDWPPRSRTRVASPTACPGPWSWARRGT